MRGFIPNDINDAGDVIGGGVDMQGAVRQPFLIRASGEVVKIGMLPGMIRARAGGMNNRGDFVGIAFYR